MSLRKIGKEEFVLRVQTDLLEIQMRKKYSKRRQRYLENSIYRDYAKERHDAYLRALRYGHSRRAAR